MANEAFLIVGGGKMGEAIVSGWLRSAAATGGSIGSDAITIVEPDEARRGALREKHGVACVSDIADASRADIVVLAVKPQVMFEVLKGVSSWAASWSDGSASPSGDLLFVSIAAGITTQSIEANLGEGAHVVRVMPNMPLQVGAGASGVCGGAHATSDQVAHVAELFGRLGRAVIVDESDMDAVCALSGSGPAYVAALIEAMRDAASKQGLDSKLAETLALQTVLGTARLIDESGLSAQVVREAVCSPGGTTLAALDAMTRAGFSSAIDAGIAAAVTRSRELAECS